MTPQPTKIPTDRELFIGGLLGRVQKGEFSENNDPAKMIAPSPLAETVYVLNRADYTREQLSMLVFLQGVVNRYEAALFIDDGRIHHEVVERYKQMHPAQKFVYDVTDPWALVGLFADKFGGAFVTYGTLEEADPTVIMASNLASADGVLGVPEALRDEALAHGLTELRDLRVIGGTYAERQQAILDECMDKFRTKRILMHINPKELMGRDIGIAQGALFFFMHDTKSDPVNAPEERVFRSKIFRWADPAAKVLGFWADKDETVFINSLSVEGKTVSPAQDFGNSSFISALGEFGEIKQPKYKGPHPVTGKHTICFYVTDGDNLTGIINNGGVCAPYDRFVKLRRESGDAFPFAYTTNPMMWCLQPATAEHLSGKSELYGLGPNDSYMAGTSGIGACHTFQIPERNLKDYARITAESMDKMDLHIFTSAEELKFNPFMGLYSKRVIDEFAQYDAIHGAFIQVSPWHYSGGLGRVYWSSNGKPWIAVRTTIWGKDGERKNVTPEWLDGFAASLNKRSKNTSAIDGYSMISIHPWSMSYADIQYIVARLNLDDVQIVSPEILLQMVKAYVPRKNRYPYIEKAF